MAKFIVVDEKRCLACRQCVISCALAHSDADSVIDAAVDGKTLTSRIHLEATGETSVPVHCLHCDDAPCMASCKVDAISRTEPDGPVLITADECIGCTLCVKGCSYGAVTMTVDDDGKKKAVKCDLCVERTAVGDEPACVAACPTRAISYCELNDDARARQREAARTLAADVTTG